MNRNNEYTSWRQEADLDELVSEWHDLDDEVWDSLGQPSLSQYLGLTDQEYALWVQEPGWIDKKLAEE